MLLVSFPIFLIIFFGWLSRRFKIINDGWIHVLNSFTYYISLPALIIGAFWEINFLDENSLKIISWSLFGIILFCFLVFLFLSFLKISKSVKTAIFLSATAGNTIYMGFPLIELGLGSEYLLKGAVIGVIYLIVPLLASIFVIRYWHSRENDILRQIYEFMKNPLVISVIVGVILSFLKLDFELISGAKKSIAMLGATASPVSLFVLGGFFYKRFLMNDLKEVLFISFLKIIVFPLIIIAVSFYFFENNDLRVFALLASMPVAVTTFVISEKFNINNGLVGNSIFISTILSLITSSVLIFILK
ncbi:MAG: AEC family transporter [Patescibacteria group bacterium]